MAIRKITIEVEVPEGLEWLSEVIEGLSRRLAAYALLQAKAQARLDEEDIQRLAEEARRLVWERVRDA